MSLNEGERQIRSGDESRVVVGQLSTVGPSEALPTPVAGAFSVPVRVVNDDFVDVSFPAANHRPPPLVGRRIPSRSASVRRRVVALYDECHWLTGADLPAATRWATLHGRFQRIAERLDALPVVRDDDEPRKLEGELRALSATLSGLERDLGITASARAALGVNIARIADPSALLRGSG